MNPLAGHPERHSGRGHAGEPGRTRGPEHLVDPLPATPHAEIHP